MKASTSPQEYLNLAIEELKNHDLDSARNILGDSLFHYFDNPQLLGMMKYVAYWQEREKQLRTAQNNFQKTEFIMEQWSAFQGFCRTIKFHDDKSLFGIRQYVFGSALEYLSAYNNEQGLKEPDILYRVGLCLKALGDYPAAQKFLETANSLKKNNPAILADMADNYAFLNEMDLAKLLFRESLSINAQEIRLDFLESALIRRLVDSVQAEGYSGPELLEWLPVYGYVQGVLNVKRELRALEYGKLLQQVYQLEREILDQRCNLGLKIPQVLNKYFWLIDYYSRSRDDQHRIRELLLKIKGFSPKIHELYTR